MKNWVTVILDGRVSILKPTWMQSPNLTLESTAKLVRFIHMEKFVENRN